MKANKILILAAIIIAGIILVNLASALTLISVSTNPSEVSPGGRVSVDLTVKNNLNDDATDVTISLGLTNVPFAPYQSSSQVNFDEILEDKSKYVGFNLIVDSDAASGTYKIPVNISYNLDDIPKQTFGVIGIIVDAEPKIDISLEDGVLIKGKNNDLNIKIVNSGLGGAKFLYVQMQEISGLKLLSPASIYLGSLDSDDFDTADFKVFINENSNIISLPVTLTYTDARNNQITENLNLQLKTYTTKQAIELGLMQKSNTGTIIISVVVLVILFLVYIWIRKRLKKKKLENQE